MIRWLYNLGFPLAFVLLLPGFLRRMFKRGNFRAHFWQRFGFFAPDVRARFASGPPRPWLQAVSVGEMLVALKVIAALREQEPGLSMTLSTTTTTGYQLATERVPAGVEVIYTPVDFAGAVRRTFRTVRPSQLVIVDGGLWPNHLWEAKRRQVPSALVNARLSPRSERRFRKFRRLSASLFSLLDLVAVPEKTDVERWRSLGVLAGHLRWTGSVKFDDAPEASRPPSDGGGLRAWLSEIGVSADARILLAGSSHPGEEKLVGSVYVRLREKFPDLFFIVVPRHAERAATVRADLEGLGLRVSNRTAPGDAAGCDALLIDTTGELRSWYAVATLVFVGKSLTGIGGQNPAEAVAAGKPVLFGPHMENFEDFVSALLAADGAVQVRNVDELAAACERLLVNAAAAATVAANASRALEAHRGAAARTAELLLAQAKISPC